MPNNFGMMDFNCISYIPIEMYLSGLSQKYKNTITSVYAVLTHTKISYLESLLFIITYDSANDNAQQQSIYSDLANILSHDDIANFLYESSPIYNYHNGLSKKDIYFCVMNFVPDYAKQLLLQFNNFYEDRDIPIHQNSFTHINEIENPKPYSALSSSFDKLALIPNTINQCCNNCYAETIQLFHNGISRYCPKCKI